MRMLISRVTYSIVYVRCDNSIDNCKCNIFYCKLYYNYLSSFIVYIIVYKEIDCFVYVSSIDYIS